MAQQPQREVCPPMMTVRSGLLPDAAHDLVAAHVRSGTRKAQPWGALAWRAPLRWCRENAALFHLFTDAVEKARSHAWPVAYAGFHEPLMLCSQDDFSGDEPWHMDLGAGVSSCRKLTLTLELTHPDEYDGAEIEVHGTAGVVSQARRPQGDIMVWPAYTASRVTPVTRGVRWSVKGFLTGPPFV